MTGDDRLRAILEDLESSAPGELQPTRPLAPTSHRLIVFSIALTAIAAVFLGVALPRFVDSLRPVAVSPSVVPNSAEPTQLTAEPTATASSEVPAVVYRLAWTSVRFPEEGALLNAVASIGNHILVAGEGEGGGPAIWYSEDEGHTWIQAAINYRSVPLGVTEEWPINTLVATQSTVIAAGYSAADPDQVQLWWSNDRGRSWTFGRPPVDGPFSIIAAEFEFLGMGRGAGPQANASIWRSERGLEWERLPDDLPDGSSISGVAARGDTRVYGLSDDREAFQASLTPRIWVVPDGEAGREIHLSESMGGVSTVTAWEGGFVASGYLGDWGADSTAAAWISEEGLTWREVKPSRDISSSGSWAVSNWFGSLITGSYYNESWGQVFRMDPWFVSTGSPLGHAQSLPVDVVRGATARNGDFVALGDCRDSDPGCPTSIFFGRPESTGPSPSPAPTRPPIGNPSTVSGILHGDPQLEIGCIWLRDDSGNAWEIIWPEPYREVFRDGQPVLLREGQVVARPGDRITVSGAIATDRGSWCMVGIPYQATAVEEVDLAQ
jgi:hypothetical protein